MARLRTIPSRLQSLPPRLARPPETSRQETRALHTGSAEWRRIREQVLARDGHRCQACGRLVAGKKAHVDHRYNDAATNRGWDLSTLWLLCLDCHSAKTAAEQQGRIWEPKGIK